MRKGKSKKRYLLPDPRFQEPLVTRFVNNLMVDGKKNKAYKLFYDAIDIVTEKTTQNGLEVWKKALENVTPQVEVKTRRIGGANYQIPQEVRAERKTALAMKWLIHYATERKEHSISKGLSSEIIAASKQEGGAFKKREDTHRMAEANKAYSHFKIK
ncbi:MAG: 30S ribosomal protein S7 [Bacteroidota bacterium]